MCYSAQVCDAYSGYCDQFGADIDIETFARLYGMKLHDNRIKTPPAMDAAFASGTRVDLQHVRDAIEQHTAQQISTLGEEIVAQRERLATAEQVLQTKATKKATDDKRIATNWIERALEKLVELQRDGAKGGDARMYPGYFVPVLIMENGKKIVRPMRYQCRIAGSRRTSLPDSPAPIAPAWTTWMGFGANSSGTLMASPSLRPSTIRHRCQWRQECAGVQAP